MNNKANKKTSNTHYILNISWWSEKLQKMLWLITHLPSHMLDSINLLNFKPSYLELTLLIVKKSVINAIALDYMKLLKNSTLSLKITLKLLLVWLNLNNIVKLLKLPKKQILQKHGKKFAWLVSLLNNINSPVLLQWISLFIQMSFKD